MNFAHIQYWQQLSMSCHLYARFVANTLYQKLSKSHVQCIDFISYWLFIHNAEHWKMKTDQLYIGSLFPIQMRTMRLRLNTLLNPGSFIGQGALTCWQGKLGKAYTVVLNKVTGWYMSNNGSFCNPITWGNWIGMWHNKLYEFIFYLKKMSQDFI